MSLTKEQKETYLNNPNKCPFCGSEQIESVNNMEVDTRIAWQRIECMDCNEEWTDEYKLVNVTA